MPQALREYLPDCHITLYEAQEETGGIWRQTRKGVKEDDITDEHVMMECVDDEVLVLRLAGKQTGFSACI